MLLSPNQRGAWQLPVPPPPGCPQNCRANWVWALCPPGEGLACPLPLGLRTGRRASGSGGCVPACPGAVWSLGPDPAFAPSCSSGARTADPRVTWPPQCPPALPGTAMASHLLPPGPSLQPRAGQLGARHFLPGLSATLTASPHPALVSLQSLLAEPGQRLSCSSRPGGVVGQALGAVGGV